MSKRCVVVAEDRLGFVLATDLADRVVGERSTWLSDHWDDDASRNAFRVWSSLDPSSQNPWSTRGDVKRLSKERGLRTQGLGLKAEGAIAYKASRLARMQSPGVDALFLVHDTDGDEATADRIREGASSRTGAPLLFEILVAAPHPEVEAWVAAGIAPLTSEERDKLTSERQRLGFDPASCPERLSSKRKADKRDAKRVCETILGSEHDSPERWMRCWKETALEVLEQNGERAGLRDYTRQVEERILPLLGDRVAP